MRWPAGFPPPARRFSTARPPRNHRPPAPKKYFEGSRFWPPARGRSPAQFPPGYSSSSTSSPEYLTQLPVVKETRYGFRFTLQWVLEEIAISNRRFLLNQRDSLKTLGRILFTNPPHRRPKLAVLGFSGSRTKLGVRRKAWYCKLYLTLFKIAGRVLGKLNFVLLQI